MPIQTAGFKGKAGIVPCWISVAGAMEIYKETRPA